MKEKQEPLYTLKWGREEFQAPWLTSESVDALEQVKTGVPFWDPL